MEEIRLSNPLSDKEKLSASRLFLHKIDDAERKISLNFGNQELEEACIKHMTLISQAAYFIQQDNFSLWENIPQYIFTNKFEMTSMAYFLKRLESIYFGKLETSIEDSRDFLACKPVLHVVLSNLIENSIAEQEKSSSEEKIVLRVGYQEGFPKSLVYVPRGARDYQNFMFFRIEDKGKGFSDDKLLERLTTDNYGFGLYFTGLAARLLRAPIEIHSEPGNTSVSFFNPIYSED